MTTRTEHGVTISGYTTGMGALTALCLAVYGKSWKETNGKPATVLQSMRGKTVLLMLPKQADYAWRSDKSIVHGRDGRKASSAMSLIERIVEHAKNEGVDARITIAPR